MPTLNAETRTHLWRLVRITAFGLATAPAVVSLFNSWVARYPLLAGLPAVLEVIWRTIAPTVPAPPPVARHASTTITYLTQPAPAPTAEQVYTPVTPPAAKPSTVPPTAAD